MSKKVVVTGAASGIGKAIAEKYQFMGFTVIGIDRNAADCDFELINCDLMNESRVIEVFETLRKKYKKIDYLINVAGVFFVEKRHMIADMDIFHWNATLQNNLTSTMLCCKYAIPLMESDITKDRAIINISSDQAIYPRKRNSAYAISKSGISCLTKVLAQELLSNKIRVNAIAPASVKTNFINVLEKDGKSVENIYLKENIKMPLGLIMPEDVAELAYFLGSSMSKRITGQIIMMDSGYYEKGE